MNRSGEGAAYKQRATLTEGTLSAVLQSGFAAIRPAQKVGLIK